MRADVQAKTDRLAAASLADRYIGPNGEPPSVRDRAKRAKARHLSDDDRAHLVWALAELGGVAHSPTARAAFEFIEAVLESDYELSKKALRL